MEMDTLSLALERLEGRMPLPPLCPEEVWDEQLSKQIEEATDQEITEQDEPSLLAAKATRSGLFLWNDDLDASHTISQDIPEALGSYWHGIMHRREGDFSNSKFWFSKVGRNHAVYDQLYQQGCKIWPELQTWGEWKPDRFIDEVEKAVSTGESSTEAELLKKIQVLEFTLLVRHSLQS